MNALVVLATVVELVTGGGRKPYGGALDLRVGDITALTDPHVAADRSGRMIAGLVHCHLFRPVQTFDGRIDIVPELAAGVGTFTGGTLTLTLVEAARFHDDAQITPADVVASFKRLAQVGPLKKLFAEVKASEAGARAVALTFPKTAQLDEVMALLARPEAAILHGGRTTAGSGCGPYKVVGPQDSGQKIELRAFSGHAEGRPFLDVVRLKVQPENRDDLAKAFRYRETDVAWEPVPSTTGNATNLGGGWASWFAVFRPGLEASDRVGLRKKMWSAASEGRLARYVDGRGVGAQTPWPEPLSAAGTKPGVGDATTLLGLVIAYPDGDDELAELARALRDTLRMIASDNARVVAVRGLTAKGAAAQNDPIWDLAVVRHEWAALTRDTAALELADLLGLPGLAASEVLSGQTRRWADGIVSRVDILPLVHAPRGVLVQPGIYGLGASSGVPSFPDGYRKVQP